MLYFENIKSLFTKVFEEKPIEVHVLPASGSNRKYIRLISLDKSAIGAYNPDKKENEAFLYLTEVFRKKNLSVPDLFGSDQENNVYLLQDLGDTTLYSLLQANGIDEKNAIIDKYYKEAVKQLVRFQMLGSDTIDFEKCFPVPAFNRRSILWDLNYFKYYFLKTFDVHFNELSLENDFEAFSDLLLRADFDYFMHRDFQARNIMIKNDKLYFIDYQGGRKGPLQYDLASLLFQARADLSVNARKKLLQEYLAELETLKPGYSQVFLKHYYHFVYLRLFQVLGAYGYRGKIEKKPHFIHSIPFAIKNLRWLLENKPFPEDLSELKNILNQIINKKISVPSANSGKLEVKIKSFSYKSGIPDDYSGNGGGFVFDCRALPNPGRIEKYRSYTGKDKSVIEYLSEKQEVKEFIDHVCAIIFQSVDNYKSRGFNNLMINFGCTGGQHRSVFCAESLYNKLKDVSDVNATITHTQLSD